MEELFNLKFKELRRYISYIDRLSICLKETSRYETYLFIRDVPETFDDYYVYGIGTNHCEFVTYTDYFNGIRDIESAGQRFDIEKCIEILLSKTPRTQC